MWKIINILLILFCAKPIFSQTNQNKPINIHECTDVSPTQILSTTMGPCYDTPGCVMPDCCGVTSGTITNITFTYVASISATGATTHGRFDSIGTGVGPNDDQIQLIAVEMPNLLVPYDSDACAYTQCPQTAGEIYTFSGVFTIPLTAVTSLTLTGNFIALLQSTDPGTPTVYCKAVYVRIVNKNFIPSLENILNNPPLGK